MIKTGTGATKRITDDEVKEVLKINDDALQSIQYEHLLDRDLNDFFNARSDGRVNVNNYWDSTGVKHRVAIYSRRSFKYPVLAAHGKWPTGESGLDNYIGFEAGCQTYLFIAALRQAGTTFQFRCGAYAWISLVVTDLMPADYDTADNLYTFVVSRTRTELYIEKVLKAVVLHSVSEPIPKWENNPPYALGGIAEPTPIEITTLLENNSSKDVVLGFGTGYNFVASDGDPLPPRQYLIYTENSSTKWVGNSFSDTITSHPVPVWGYPKKCFLFQSNAAGTIAIEVYAGGGWREVVSETVTANELWDYVLNLEVPIARMKYTPTNSDTIAVAECNLS